MAHRAVLACASVTFRMSSRVAFLAKRIDSGLKNLTGASALAPLVRALVTGPAWPICALIAAPSAWTASVSWCSPGSAFGRIQSCQPSVRPPGITA